MKELKINDPVMWKRKEYKFITHDEGNPKMGWIQKNKQEPIRRVAVEELDLIIEFDFGG